MTICFCVIIQYYFKGSEKPNETVATSSNYKEKDMETFQTVSHHEVV